MRSDMNIGREKPAMENFVCALRAAVHTVARKPGFTIVKRSVDREETSPADFFDWQEQNQSFEELGMAEPWGHLLIGDGEPEAIRSWVVSPGFFEALGAPPLLGRTFLPEEYQQGAGPVVVLGYNWWQQHFGGDRNLIGQKLTLNNQATTVVGIMPPEFEYPPGREV